MKYINVVKSLLSEVNVLISIKFTRKEYSLVFFIITVLFQLTALKYMWGLESISRIVNVFTILILNVFIILSLIRQRFNFKIWLFYYIPGFFLYIGMLFNFIINSISDFSNLSYFGLLIPWLVYFSVPIWMKIDRELDIRLWRYFYYFMIVGVSLALIEYFYVFFFGGVSSLRTIETSGGVFLSGIFGIYYPLETGGVHFRMYGSFLEPGTLGMFLIPAMAYAFYSKKFVSIIIMLAGVFAAFSLGTFISIVLLVFTIYLYTNKKLISFPTLFFLIFAIAGALQIGTLKMQYDAKSESRTARTENVRQGVTKLPSMILSHPFGMEFNSLSDGDLNSAHSFANFMPVHKLIVGGFFAFVGYIVVLLVSVWFSVVSCRLRNLTLEEKVVFSSLLPLFLFVVQRTTIWESAIFAFLFSPSIIRQLERK